MARDPPSLLAASELRDLPLEPSAILDARITIIHPQLRDLILPVEKRRVLYPRGSTVEELRWTERDDEGQDCDLSGKSGKVPYPYGCVQSAELTQQINSSITSFVKLNFTPNCLTGSGGMLAAGGQHGELHMSHVPCRTTTRPWDHGPLSAPGQEAVLPFRLDVKLGTSAINNSIVILPEWPLGWAQASERKRVGYVGRRPTEYEEMEMDGIDGAEEDDDIEDNGGDGADDEAMDLDEEEEEEDDGGGDGSPQPLSPATYPNTVSFRHAPRIPTASDTLATISARRAASFSHPRPRLSQGDSTRLARQSFSIVSDNHPQRIRIVSSNPNPSYPARRPSYATQPIPTPFIAPNRANVRARADPRARQGPEPRVLVSSNDQSIRMLVLRQLEAASHHDPLPVPRPRTTSFYERESEAARLGGFEPTIRTHYRPPATTSSLMSTDWRGLHPVLPPPPQMMGSRFGWDTLGVNQGLLEAHRAEQMAAQRELRTRQINHFEAAVGLGPAHGNAPVRPVSIVTSDPAVRLGAQAPWSQVRATAGDARQGKRVVSTVGGKTLNFPVNHSSFSPDLKTMVSVGDSTDVQIFEVMEGGREFRQIATYSAATDSAFSSAWSKDGRKFAVASQDGQVTVWDHRSSRPLATLFTSASGTSPGPSSITHDPSFSVDIAASRRSPSPEDGWSRDRGIMLFNPVTGEPSSGASTSGREAARVIKFSPEGSSRDLMVFSEENTNIHIVDAKSFNTHVILPVPIQLRGNSDPISHRSGVENGECGIAGIAFDPTGEWLYSGTERTIVEWGMRRFGGGEGGGWDMA